MALLFLAAYQFMWFPTNYRMDGVIFHPANYSNVLLVVCALLGYRAKSRAIQGAAAFGFLAVLLVAITFFFGFTAALPG